MSTRSAGITLAPPAIYLVFVLFAWALTAQLPLALPWPAWIDWPAGLLIGLGLALMAWAVLAMFRLRTTVNPYGRPLQLVVGGPFRLSRNPIYLGDTLVFCGIGLSLGSLWPWLLLPALVACMNAGVIRREEAFLAALFGDGYREYCRRVRRWL